MITNQVALGPFLNLVQDLADSENTPPGGAEKAKSPRCETQIG